MADIYDINSELYFAEAELLFQEAPPMISKSSTIAQYIIENQSFALLQGILATGLTEDKLDNIMDFIDSGALPELPVE